jgi:hypothetical protein
MSNRVKRASDLGLSINEILARVAQIAGAKNDTELALALRAGRSSLPTWRKADTIPFEPLFEFAKTQGVSIDWLLTGEGDSKASDALIGAQRLMVEDAVLGNIAAARKRGRLQEPQSLGWVRFDAPLMEEVIRTTMQECARRKLSPSPERFSKLCVAFYEIWAGTGTPPASSVISRLLETLN